MRWNWDRRFVHQVVATLIRGGRRDLLHGFLVMAMSLDTAKKLLGFDEAATPSADEVSKAWKKKALQHHPDRGGDAEMMKQINVAHDVLTGKQRPDGGDSGSRRPGPRESAPYQWSRPETKKVRVSWDEARQKAGVPTSGVDWKFATQKGFGGYSTGSRNESKSGFVLYGRSDKEHVFVSVFQHSLDDLYSATDRDIVRMQVQKHPLTKDLAGLAPKVIREMWKDFDDVKNYNAKVHILPADTKFDQGITRLHGIRPVSFKNAMGLMGEATPTTWKGKVDVVLELGRDEKMGEYPATLVVNGKPYRLSDASNNILRRAGFFRVVFGTYYYEGSKKNVTRIKKAKIALTFLAEKLKGEPQDLMDALKAAAEKAK